MANQFNLTPSQVVELQSLTNDGTTNFAAGYSYVYGLIKDSSQVDGRTKFWFQQAIEINGNDPLSASNTFIRTVTQSGLLLDGRSIDDNDKTIRHAGGDIHFVASTAPREEVRVF